LKSSKILYALLWVVAVIAYSVPWAKIITYTKSETFTGWSFTVPFSFTYVLGLAIGALVLISEWKPSIASVVAGILMLVGVVGGMVGYTIAAGLCELEGGKAVTAEGMGFAFLVSVAYIILGGYLGKKLEKV